MSVSILTGDCRDVMRAMDPESVDCVVTSPPYWGLRDYGVPGQLGLEPTLAEHIATMVDVFECARRVLKKSGTLWLNYGDSYAAQVNGRSAHDVKLKGDDDRTFRDKPMSTIGPITYKPRPGEFLGGDPKKHGTTHSARNHNGTIVDRESRLKPKDLCMVPNRLAIALQEAGWWVRSEIIWAKPNPMPESVRDRPTSAHEKIWLLTKSERYFYDAEAIREEAEYGRRTNPHEQPREGRQSQSSGRWSAVGDRHEHPYRGNSQRDATYDPDVGRNRRNVWTVPSQPFSDAHFATFPPALIEPCILAGCPKGGTVLDPFGGSGTTGMVADRLGRNAVLIELNAKYAAMAQSRIVNDLPLFAEVTA